MWDEGRSIKLLLVIRMTRNLVTKILKPTFFFTSQRLTLQKNARDNNRVVFFLIVVICEIIFLIVFLKNVIVAPTNLAPVQQI